MDATRNSCRVGGQATISRCDTEASRKSRRAVLRGAAPPCVFFFSSSFFQSDNSSHPSPMVKTSKRLFWVRRLCISSSKPSIHNSLTDPQGTKRRRAWPRTGEEAMVRLRDRQSTAGDRVCRTADANYRTTYDLTGYKRRCPGGVLP